MRKCLLQKAILVACVFSVLLFSFCLTSGASNYYESDGVLLRPLFAPEIITINTSWPESISIDINNSLVFDTSDTYYYSNSSSTDINSGTFYTNISFSKMGSLHSLYGYEYIDFGYIIEFSDPPNVDYAPTDYISFYFTDIYLSPEVISHYGFFGTDTAYLDTDLNEYTGSHFCSWKESYVDGSGELITRSLNSEFDSFGGLLYYYSVQNFPNGVFLSDIEFTLYFNNSNEFTSEFFISGGSPYVPIESIPSPLDAWSEFFGDTNITIVESPTILESIQTGLDAVWNTSLFGLFTIGTVFSACAGVALFAWLLKIFNR